MSLYQIRKGKGFPAKSMWIALNSCRYIIKSLRTASQTYPVSQHYTDYNGQPYICSKAEH